MCGVVDLKEYWSKYENVYYKPDSIYCPVCNAELVGAAGTPDVWFCMRCRDEK